MTILNWITTRYSLENTSSLRWTKIIVTYRVVEMKCRLGCKNIRLTLLIMLVQILGGWISTLLLWIYSAFYLLRVIFSAPLFGNRNSNTWEWFNCTDRIPLIHYHRNYGVNRELKIIILIWFWGITLNNFTVRTQKWFSLSRLAMIFLLCRKMMQVVPWVSNPSSKFACARLQYFFEQFGEPRTQRDSSGMLVETDRQSEWIVVVSTSAFA